MISVCIPVFNYPVQQLVDSLVEQAKSVKETVEVVCIDDCSSEEYRKKNANLSQVATFVQLEENVGRAKIRNLFLQYARGEWLLFLDNDSEVKDGFLKGYVDALPGEGDVIVGGRVYDERGNTPQCRLRYQYGVRVESKCAAVRRKHPYRSFMTNNFLIRRDVMERVRFDEGISRYGHEDTLFGYRLEQEGVTIRHIDNPVVNGEVEQNADFLYKSGEAVRNLAMIYRRMEGEKEFSRTVRLLRYYNVMKKAGGQRIVLRWFNCKREKLEREFVDGTSVSMTRFSFYKLGLFIKCLTDEEQ